MTEIFDTRRRFQLVDSELLGFEPNLIVMTNVGWWADNLDTVLDWLRHNCQGRYKWEGMTLQFQLESDASAFCLCWSD